MLTGTFALKLCKIKIPMQVIFTKLIIYFFCHSCFAFNYVSIPHTSFINLKLYHNETTLVSLPHTTIFLFFVKQLCIRFSCFWY